MVGSSKASVASVVRPLIWSDLRAGVIGAGVFGWLMSIELRTSRTASREAAKNPEGGERVIDTSTSDIFDVAAATSMVGGVAASLAFPSTLVRHRRASFLAGVVLLVGSGFLSVIAKRHLGRFHRDSLTIHDDHEVVETGPYRVVRHPLYTATIASVVGIGAALGNWISIGLASLPSMAILHRINVEEAMLVDALGADYDSYRKRTKRLLPWVW